MKPEIIAWSLAWEGWIGLTKCSRSKGHAMQYTPHITIGNTDIELLKKFRDITGCGHIYTYNTGKTYKSNWRVQAAWQINNTFEVLEFLQEIYGFLPAKQPQANLLMEFCRIRLDRKQKGYKGFNMRSGINTWSIREEEIYQELKKLNKRGRN